MSEHHHHELKLETIEVRIHLERHGLPTEEVVVAFEGSINHLLLAQNIAEVLQLEAEEILAEISNPEVLHPEHHYGNLKLACVEVHFETESAKHHFPPSATWERVHQWGCKRFKVASDACANLEVHSGDPKGPVLNEAKPIGHHHGCAVVWLVKPGPENNG